MAYFGRILAVGMTVSNEPAVVYGISGRSASSKKRKLVEEKYKDLPCIHVREVGELTEDQKNRYDIFFYPAIVGSEDEDGTSAVVTNGDHTKDAVGYGILSSDLRSRQYEPDDYSTPRIAGKIRWLIDDDPIIQAALLAKQARSFASVERTENGLFVCLSTYQGNDEPSKPETGKIWFQKFKGSTPAELANELYEWMDPGVRVAAGSAVMNDNSFHWELGVKNLHE